MTTSQVRSQTPREWVLDLFRIACTIAVVLFHWVGQPSEFLLALHIPFPAEEIPEWFQRLCNLGYLGVDFFFILSGIVISHSALNRTWQKFSQARFLRLFPVYFAATIIAIALKPLVQHQDGASHWLDFTGLIVVREVPLIGAAWSLKYEISFYALVTLAIFALKGLTRGKLLLSAWLFMTAIVVAQVLKFEPLSIATLAPYGMYFVFGVLLGTTNSLAELRKNVFGLVIGFFLLAMAMTDRIHNHNTNWAASTVISVVSILAISAIALVSGLGLIKWTPGRTVLRWVTTLSLMTYPVYLLHGRVGISLLKVLTDSGMGLWQAEAIVGVIVLVAAYALVKWFEPIARKLLSRWFGWNRT